MQCDFEQYRDDMREGLLIKTNVPGMKILTGGPTFWREKGGPGPSVLFSVFTRGGTVGGVRPFGPNLGGG